MLSAPKTIAYSSAITLRPAFAAPRRLLRSRTASWASASTPSRCASVATSIAPASLSHAKLWSQPLMNGLNEHQGKFRRRRAALGSCCTAGQPTTRDFTRPAGGAARHDDLCQPELTYARRSLQVPSFASARMLRIFMGGHRGRRRGVRGLRRHGDPTAACWTGLVRTSSGDERPGDRAPTTPETRKQFRLVRGLEPASCAANGARVAFRAASPRSTSPLRSTTSRWSWLTGLCGCRLLGCHSSVGMRHLLVPPAASGVKLPLGA